jgi:hypothetical protein
MRKSVLTSVTASLFVLGLAACGDGGAHTVAPDEAWNPYHLTTTGPGVLSVTPLDTSTIFAITPLGSLAPPGHVLPTDHIYISYVDPWNGNQQNNDCRARPVRAAGSGVIDFIMATEAQGDTKVDVQMTKTFHYYYDHVLLKPGMVLGTRVNAGDTIATTTGRCPSMDLGVFDFDATPTGFVNTKRYAGGSLHVVPPLRYFIEPLRTFLYAHVRVIDGVPADKDGRTDFGIRGKLVGDWFHSSLANDSASVISSSVGWSKSISFAYEWFAHAPRISVGGVIASPGLLAIAPTDPDPATISVASGKVAYRGTSVLGSIGSGWVLVEMLTDERMRIEFFQNASTRPTAFTSAAQEYVR